MEKVNEEIKRDQNLEPKTDDGKKLKSQKLLYHLTPYKNLKSILKNGLQPRSMLKKVKFEDTANHEILDKRKKAKLDECVPFHFFANGPYDGSVRKHHADDDFAYICVAREKIKNNCSIIVAHPLNHDQIELKSWDDGMSAIDWDLMGKRNYADEKCKQMCMSEALYKGKIAIDMIQSIRIAPQYEDEVKNLKEELKATFYIDKMDILEAYNKQKK